MVQIVDGGVDVIEFVLSREEVDAPLPGHRHQLGQLVVVADQAAHDGDLAEDQVDRRDLDHAPVPDDPVDAALLEHCHGLGDRRALTDEVDDGLGALPVGQLQHLRDRVPV